ncbi:GtrA family protein [Actinomadura sp. NEAU-AAG7]|uniref:GtrA family protein n=1 Tax=Actinomadura sp. NEAU-AAG7 TaxID=2839640 RepID=UPI001BE43419|nr:GtrA family protein [Actinomadura sp. NEAU-AAG7]MBT2210580.1 GtrA family protein [Actinomadura sp. NEAU-AAG7]
MTIASAVLERIPEQVRPIIIRQRVLLKFGMTGGLCYAVTTAIYYALKFTLLQSKPVTALLVATAAATALSYVLQRRWAFRVTNGRRRSSEILLFVLINAISMGINAIPLYAARYWFGLAEPHVSQRVQEFSDFFSGMIIGTLLAMLFRWWAYRSFVFSSRNLAGEQVERRSGR